MIRRACVAAMAASLVATVSCQSVETDRDKDESKTYVGCGAVVGPRPYTGADAKVHPVPLSACGGERLHLRGPVGGYRLLTGQGWSLGPVIHRRFEGSDEDDSAAPDGMDNRLWSLDAGAGLSWPTKIGLFRLSGVADTLGRHEAQELEFSYTVLFNLCGFDFIPSAGMRWKSRDLVDYYYGVRPNETRAGRPAYEGESAFDPFVRLAALRQLTGRWSLLAAVQYEWLDDPITDSPVEDTNHDVSLIVGMLYEW